MEKTLVNSPVPMAWMKHSDILMGVAFVAIVIMIIIPMPTFLLNFLIALNITVAVIILLSVTYIKTTTDFSVFPSALLMTTLFRLALNISSTRLILLKGRVGVEGVITAFGEFVVGGNYVVGMIIFIIIFIVQFFVIVKGTTRISEVAARFTLDSMPGKQMAIDADLNSGIIDQSEAERRREAITREADFYGAMDGASKFVQGDVTAGIIITFINILGGIAIGVFFRGEDVAGALGIYALLTIGDGLVSQIPALLISTAAGLIVTRAAEVDNLGESTTKQLLSQPKVLFITSGSLAGLGLFTQLPTIPFILLATLAGYIGYQIYDSIKQEEYRVAQIEEEARKAEEKPKKENIAQLLRVDPMEIEIGYGLINLVDPEKGGELLGKITTTRRNIALSLGLVVPPIRIRDNMQLKPNYYVIKIKGIEVAQGQVFPDKFLAMNNGSVLEEIPGIKTKEPVFGMDALWLTEENREKAESAGYITIDAASVIATHLNEIIKINASDILGRNEMLSVLNELKKTYENLVDEVVPNLISYSELQKILQNLVREEISIRNMVTILETAADKASSGIKDTILLTEYIRKSLSRQITQVIINDDNCVHAISVSPQIEEALIKNLKTTPAGHYFEIDPNLSLKILQQLKAGVEKIVYAGLKPAVIVHSSIRKAFKDLTYASNPKLSVIAVDEILPGTKIKVDFIIK